MRDELDEADEELPVEDGGEAAPPPARTRENLLDRLLFKGVLPRYAFPTDVVAFHIFDVNRSEPFRHEYLYAPSQGLDVALSQYAPGKNVWVDNREWTSGAIYSPIEADRFQAWRDKKLYFECQVCHYALTVEDDEASCGEERDCPACGAEAKFGEAMNWMRPPGFAHPAYEDAGTSPDDASARSYATRAKLSATGEDNTSVWQDLTPRIEETYRRDELLVTNTGPDRKGYSYCTKCGLIEPTKNASGRTMAPHKKPYPDEKEPDCLGSGSTPGLVLGTAFISDVLLVRLKVDDPVALSPGLLGTQVALRTLAEALTIEATSQLEIEASELQAEFRPALTARGNLGLDAEIYLYDTLPGGAGFARRVADLGRAIFEGTLTRLETCPAKCDESCYQCLRSFGNRFEHTLLDRHLGASLLRYLLRDEPPVLNQQRLDLAADKLYGDLRSRGLDGITLERNVEVDIPGIGAVVAPILATKNGQQCIFAVHGPLTPSLAPTPKLAEAKDHPSIEVRLVDDIVIARNLPYASQLVLQWLS
ncbi:DUF1998 domain-containing protein [Mycobacteroides abscessus]|uniref:DUF1998 domain-containing protein n=1 Tax=Mycobacteroides abscessus TaxID=36809 RepID=UPI0002E30B25|nr:DUF1998 domain-containing protein [Mycobacteroides abscessus]